jgi:cytochrome c biogenesis protein CcmG/thiol:disulfide interchange protein DsbE
VTRIRWTALVVGVIVLALGALFVAGVLHGPVESHGSLLGKPVPVVQLPRFTGGTVSTQPTTGHVVVVNFWNSWCTPCHQEEGALKAFYAKHKAEPDFTMIGVLRSDSTDAARTYARGNNMRWIMAADPGSKAAVAFGTTGQPETYVVGPDGVVEGEQIGPVSVRDLDAMLNRARGVG